MELDEKKDVQDEKHVGKGLNFVQILVLHIIIIIAILWVMFGMILGAKYAPNDDMAPNIHSGDLLVYYRMVSEYKAQDTVVLKKNGTEYVGRIVAGAGDTVEVTESEELIINGNKVSEKNIYTTTPIYEGYMNYPVHLGSGEYFVLVDSRQSGEDSRYYGVVSKDEIKGKIIMVIRRNNI